MERMLTLFAAHSPTPETMRKRCEVYFGESLSICTLIKSPDHVMRAFQHAHEEYEFMIPRSPIPFLVNEGAVYFGEVGWVFPVQSGRAHGMKYDLADVSHIDIVIRKDYFEALLSEQNLDGMQFNCEFRLSEELKLYLDAFKREFLKGHAMRPVKIEHLTALICLELIEAGANPSTDIRREKQHYQKGMRSVAEFINEHYQQDIYDEELARMCGLSKNYFIKAFKAAMGISPIAYLNKLRISKAKLLLETTSDPIHKIAEACGFTKANTFTSQFKSTTGVTPNRYREDAHRR